MRASFVLIKGTGPYLLWAYACSSVATARAGGEEAILLSSGEVLVRGAERWELRYREPVIYRGECDCE